VVYGTLFEATVKGYH